LPMTPEIALPTEHCTYPGSFCKGDVTGRFLAAKSKLKEELEETRGDDQKDESGSCNDSGSVEVQSSSFGTKKEFWSEDKSRDNSGPALKVCET
jgi:hypothetical protein